MGGCIPSKWDWALIPRLMFKILSLKNAAKPLQASVDRESESTGTGGFVNLSVSILTDVAFHLGDLFFPEITFTLMCTMAFLTFVS